MNRFLIIVSQYNAKPYIKKCLDSIMSQDYKNFEVVVVDDCSTDGTADVFYQYPFNIVLHGERQCCGVTNTIEAIDSFKTVHDDDIVVLISGDDYLYDNKVLSRLDKEYTKDVWMTYGQFIPTSGGYGPYCKPITDTRLYRHSGDWYASHPITFRKWLWDKIKDEDLRLPNGEYGHYSFDVCILYPMIEMSGKKHMRFIEDILYVYNDENPSCIYKIYPNENLNEAEYFRNKPQYDEL
jgi:glycosyltransferase involved in cell wall biosynthesis